MRVKEKLSICIWNMIMNGRNHRNIAMMDRTLVLAIREF